MELEFDIEKVFPNADETKEIVHQNPLMEIIESETFDEEESFVFQSIVFYSESKNLIIEKIDVNNKNGKSRSEVNLQNMWAYQISQTHRATRDALDDSIGGLEAENAKLKEIIKELEEALMPLPVLASPLAMIGPTTPAVKLKGYSSLLISSRGYVEKNIKKRMELITEAWEMSKNKVSFGTREHAFHEYLQEDLKNEQGFYLDTAVSFSFKVTNMT
jgi:hypothetical protein